MNYEILRPLVLEALKKNPETQIMNLINETESIARERGFYKDVEPWFYSGMEEHYMPEEDMEKVRQIIMDLILQGILVQGTDILNYTLPFIRVTDYGKECLETDEILPHDPDGYLKYLNEEIPKIDETIYDYVAESLQTFLRGNLLSSTVMLGGASEKSSFTSYRLFY